MNMSPWKFRDELNGSSDIEPTCEDVINTASPTDNLTIYFDVALTAAEETEMDVLLVAHIALDLTEYKSIRNTVIDDKTYAVILLGFTYDGEVFSLSDHAQHNWSQIKNDLSDGTLVSGDFPYKVTTIDDKEYLLTEANVSGFYDAGAAVIKVQVDLGRDLKILVTDAADETAVDAIIDDR